MIVWVSGPTGAGKSCFVRTFQSLGFSIVEEELPNELFHAFAAEPARYCALLQEEIMRSRYNGWQKVSNAPRVMFDRSIDEDAWVFCQMHRGLGLLDGQQYEHLQVVAKEFQSAMPEPDLIVFMLPQLAVLAKRVTEATHPSLIVQNLDRQVSLYSQWIATRHGNVLTMDNSACSEDVVNRLFGKGPQC